MREIFQAISELEAKRPEIHRSNVWHVEKIRHEEAGELLEVTSNDPTPEELAEMKKEAADIILNICSIMVNCGVLAEEFELAVVDKAIEIGQRPPEAFQRGIRMQPQIPIYEV